MSTKPEQDKITISEELTIFFLLEKKFKSNPIAVYGTLKRALSEQAFLKNVGIETEIMRWVAFNSDASAFYFKKLKVSND